MGYEQRASNGERPQHVTDRRFRYDAAVAITNQATAVEQLLKARESHQQLLAGLAGDYLKLRNDFTELAADYALLKQAHRVAVSCCSLSDAALDSRLYRIESRTFWQRLRWLLAGR